MFTREAVERAGSQQELADVFGITQSAISQWGAEMPQPRVYELMVKRPTWFNKFGQLIPAAKKKKSPRAVR